MPSSITRRESSERWLLASLFAVLIGAPLVVLILLQTNYTLAYWACADRTNVWLHVPNAIGVAAAAGLALFGWRVSHRVRDGQSAERVFLGVVGLMLAVMMLLVVIAFIAPPVLLYPCD
jgi:hypothetical protein